MSELPPRKPVRCPPAFQGRYIVRPGDTMFTISRFFRVSRFEALAVNNPHIPDPNLIFPGDVLCVPGLVPFPCCIVLHPRILTLPVGTEAVALVHTAARGGEAVTIAATLPQPSIFGDFNVYTATVLIPEIDGGFGDVLFPTPEDPPTFTTTIEIPTVAQLTPSTRIIIEPFKEVSGIKGPIILEGSLGECQGSC